MKLTRFTKTSLFLSGLLACAVGIALLSNPLGFYATNEIVVQAGVNALNEFRASGTFLFACGAFILYGAFNKNIAGSAVVLSVLLFGAFALGRGVSMLLDGVPSFGLVAAFAIEAVVVFIVFLSLLKSKRQAQW